LIYLKNREEPNPHANGQFSRPRKTTLTAQTENNLLHDRAWKNCGTLTLILAPSSGINQNYQPSLMPKSCQFGLLSLDGAEVTV